MIYMIAGIHENGGLGKSGKLLTRDPQDLARFKEMTMGKTVVAGRITAEGLPELPGRNLVTLGTGQDYNSVADLLGELGGQDIWIIGGGKVYESFLPLADVIYLTVFPGSPDFDTRFPDIPESDWKVEITVTRDDNVKYLKYVRK